MAGTFEFGHLFRSPTYPVILDVDGSLIAAKSPIELARKLARLQLPAERRYPAVAVNGENWELNTYVDEAILSPTLMKRRWTKLDVVRLYNQRKNRRRGEQPYSEKSLSSKRVDRVIGEIVEFLLDTPDPGEV